MSEVPTIIYTKTDEAPALATRSLLPIIKAFTKSSGIAVETRDISLAGRIIANFPESLSEGQRIGDALAELGALAKTPEANIIKLPNISASVPQLKAAIAELQSQGYDLPDYPEEPADDAGREVQARYDKIKGSAVNPVLREGNSDRRAPRAVKEYAKANPHRMGAWSADSKTDVASMAGDDFRSNEKSVTAAAAGEFRIEFVADDGPATELRASAPLLEGEVLDGTVMRKAALVSFLGEQVERAKADGTLFSLHMKATMMKVSDPIIFGHGVRAYFAEACSTSPRRRCSTRVGVEPEQRPGQPILGASSNRCRPRARSAEIEADDRSGCYANGPGTRDGRTPIAGITNLHVPSDIIIDASMPAMIRASGQMWNAEGEPQDTKAVIPDSSYAPRLLRRPSTSAASTARSTRRRWARVSERRADGAEGRGVRVARQDVRDSQPGQAARSVSSTANGEPVLIEHRGRGRRHLAHACQAKDSPIRDWVRLAVGSGAGDRLRRRCSGSTRARAHDAELIDKVNAGTFRSTTLDGLDRSSIMAPALTRRSFSARAASQDGEDTISVTGNVLRDYLTDLFPILELGTSAKMLSIVPLMNGGGLFETGAGRLGTQARPAVRGGRTTCAGTPSASSWPSPSRSSTSPTKLPAIPEGEALLGATLDRSEHAVRLLRQRQLALARGARGARQSRNATSTLRSTGRRSLAAQSDDAELKASISHRSPKQLADAESTIVRGAASGVQGAAGGHRRLFPARRRQGRRRDAPERDPERDHRDGGAGLIPVVPAGSNFLPRDGVSAMNSASL